MVEARTFQTQPKSVANESDIYPEDVEQFLANEVEEPAKAPLEALREGTLPVGDARLRVAKYLYYMWKRVPAARSRTAAIIPQAAEEVRVHTYKQLDDLIRQDPANRRAAEARKHDVDRLVAKYIEQRPSNFWQDSLRPNMEGAVPDSLLSMTWRVLLSGDGQFLTCDNPFFYFKDRGLGNLNSVFTIPISPKIVLAGDREASEKKSIVLNRRQIREVNRRTVINANRYLYYAHNEEWVSQFAQRARLS